MKPISYKQGVGARGHRKLLCLGPQVLLGFRLRDDLLLLVQGFPGSSEVKVSACNVGDLGLIPGSGRSPGEGNGNPLQYTCLENPMDGGAWGATVHCRKESDTPEQLHFHFSLSVLAPGPKNQEL